MGWKIDSQDLSFLLRVKFGEVFDSGQARVDNAATACAKGTPRSAFCFLTPMESEKLVYLNLFNLRGLTASRSQP